MLELTRAERFLDAFNRIEARLRSSAKQSDREAGFKVLVRASQQLSVSQKTRLLEVADLRNVIVHSPRDRGLEVIADPRESLVSWVETQADVIENPPKVVTALKLSAPKIFDGEAEIDTFLDSTKPPNNFSQAPFMSEIGEIRLITTNALARWVAESYRASEGLLLDSASIASVAQFSEPQDQPVFKARNFKVVDAIRLFAGETGAVAPAAILITESGKPTESPIGICTPADVPSMYRLLGI
jgi:hypothetical protein